MSVDDQIRKIGSLANLARATARSRPQAPACRFEGRTLTYQEFDRQADQVANGLIADGITPGDRVAVVARNSDHYLVIAVGIIRARAVLVAVNWRLAPPEMRYVLEHASARAVFAEAGLLGDEVTPMSAWGPTRVIGAGAAAADDYEHWRDCQMTSAPDREAELDDDVVQMYTSGTTGRPKGVCLTHRNYLTAFDQVGQYGWGNYEADEVIFAPSPYFHVSGINLAFRSLAQGACVVTSAGFQASDLPSIIRSERVNRTVMVPAVMQICLSAPDVQPSDFTSLTTVTYGGSPITRDLLRRAREMFGCQFVQGYGLTETTGQATFLQPEDHDPECGKLNSCGRAVPGMTVRVIGQDGTDCSPGQVGEVLLAGPNLMRGYWQDQAATAAAIVDGWLHTGDAGYLDEDGYLYIHDRLKDMIVSGGENIYPAEVESALADHPDVQDVAVIGVPDERWGEAVKALVVLCPGAEPDATVLLAFSRERIAGYKVPKSIDFLDLLPRNPSGKILRRELRAPYWEGHSRKVN